MPSAKRQVGTVSRLAMVCHAGQKQYPHYIYCHHLLPIELHVLDTEISIRAFSFLDGTVFIRATKIYTDLSNQITFTAPIELLWK